MITGFHDSLNLLSKLTFRRSLNAFSVLSTYYISKWTGKAINPAAPYSISFEPTTSCNLRCPECPSGLRSFTRPTGMLEKSFFTQVIDEIHSKVFYLTFYFQGEPYLNPSFLEMVRYARSKNIYTATSTNAHYLSPENARLTIESGLDRLIISIDGTTQETYSSYRVGGFLDKVIEGTKNIIEWKKKTGSRTPHVVFQFLVVKPNEHQTEEVIRLGKELGVDQVVFKTAQVYDYENGSDLIPENQKYSRYKKTAEGKYEIKSSMENSCWRMWHSCVITWDGTIVPCCFDKDASHPLGSLKEKSFFQIWNSEGYKSFRKSLLKSRSEIEICKNCSEGTKVWAE
ncbi:MAG: SPASM domain-containing protein [Cytophagaceae bacterium]